MINRGYRALLLTLDASLRYALGTRIWQALASCITLLLILRGTNPTEQGIYYTFASLANLQIFFELGLSFVILQSTSHYFKDLSWGVQGEIIGTQTDLQVLSVFARKSLRIYLGLAILFVIAMIPIGLLFFENQNDLKHSIHWSWVLLVMGMAVNLMTAPILAILEGSGKVAEVYRLRLQQLILANLLAWLTFYLTNVLFILVVNTWITAITTIGWLWRTHRQFLRIMMGAVFTKLAFSWRREIWPMQWRIAISWIAGYFLNQIFTPLIYHYQGAIVSGQMGICLLLANMLGLFAITLVTVRSPKMGELVAHKDFKNLDKVFWLAFWQSIGMFIAGAGAILSLGWVLQRAPIMARFLSWPEMAILLLAYLLVHIMGALSLYLRAHRKELFAPLSVIGAVLISSGAWYGARYYGTWGVIWSIFLVNACYGLPTALWLWVNFKRKWRNNDEQINDISNINNQYSNLEPR